VSQFCFLCCFLFTAPSSADLQSLALHDALPIWPPSRTSARPSPRSPARPRQIRSPRPTAAIPWHRPPRPPPVPTARPSRPPHARSEEHTSELQSRENLVCRLLLEKKNTKDTTTH